MDTFGPNTPAVAALLKQADTLTQRQLHQLQQAYWLTRGEGELAHRTMGRDYAWSRLHASLAETGLKAAFDRLWKHMLPRWCLPAGYAVQDAACALLLARHVGNGPFRQADLDLLMAPWRCVVEDDVRSRLALSMGHQHAAEVDEHWWATVDAILAPPPDQT